MANNIIPLDPNNFSTEVYSTSDESLITSNIEQNQFNPNTDYVEFLVFDLNNNKIIPTGNDATFSNYSLLDNEIYIDPVTDLERIGIDTGIVNTLYNFYKKRLSSSPQSTYYISEISSDRTEIRLDSNIIDKVDIISSTNEFINYRKEDETFPDFYLNLGSNLLFIANNIRLEENGTVLIKLYEPLPSNIQLKTSLWVVEKISEGNAYRVEFEDTQEFRPQFQYLQGPNLNLSIKNQLNNSSEPVSLESFSTPNTQSFSQLDSYFEDPSIAINVDYSEFSNFVNFSSAETRLRNFWDKISLIESSSNQISDLSSLSNTSAVSASKATLESIINDTIINFDNYEYYLYFESGSTNYPKSNSTPPYINVSTGSLAATTWSASLFSSASTYDELNQDWLKYSIPEYLRDDSANDQYLTFVNMVGHFVDSNIWVYLKDTTNKWNADNRINAGISKDLVAQVLRDLGVKIYQNNYSVGDLYSSFLGFTDSGSLFPFPYMTGSLPTPSGYEYISNFISSSNDAIPLDDINKRIYKRIYHNLPYLLKSKGTVEGLRTLISSYGIPDTILRISEFGGKDRNNVNDWDLWKHQYNYASQMRGTDYISSSFQLLPEWGSLNDVPSSVQFRFNAGEGSNAPTSQSLWSLDDGTQVKLVLEYDNTLPTTSGSYSGSIVNPEYQYADLKFTVDDFTTSSSLRLPFYNNDWWSVQINRTENPQIFEILTANSIYSGSDGSQIGFIESASVTTSDASFWDNGLVSWFSSENGGGIPLYSNFEGKYQEIRYFNQAISQSVFKDYVMNPQSIEGNGINGSYDQLAFRAPLGGELYTGSVSIHPKVSGSYIQNSFQGDTSNFTIQNTLFEINKEWVFYDSPAVGIKNRNTDKIKRQDLILPEGNTLSNIGSIQQKSYTTQDYTNNLNLLEVAFSPQNQINDDIISQIGFFNIGDYIGDPRLISSSVNTYPSLVDLSQKYFDKYSSNYDVYDYIRLIKFFDNSLFKMIKDFVPARTSIATGIVIKQHLLERQKYPTPQAEWTQPEYTGSIGSTPTLISGSRQYEPSGEFDSIPIETISGSDGGAILTSNVTQSWTGIYDTPVGQVEFTQDDETEFYDGEFSGSALLVSDGELNSENTLKKPTTIPLVYDIDVGYFEGGDIGLVYSTPSSGEAYWNGEINNIPRGTGFVRNVEVFSIDIHQVDKSGTNLQDVLNSLAEGTEITFRAKGRFQNFPGPGDTTLDTTFTATIATSFGLGNDVFRLILESPATLGTLSFTPLTLTTTSISNFPIIIDPLVQGGFTYSEDNAIINNVLTDRSSNIFYDLDYSSNSIQAVNQQVIISSSQQNIPGATFAEIQDFNYYSNRSTIPRYEGSKNTVESFNTGSGLNAQVSAGTYIAYYQQLNNTPIGSPTTYYATALPTHIIDSTGEIFQVTDDEEIVEILKQNFTTYNGDKIAYSFSISGSITNTSNTLPNPYIEVISGQVRIRSERTSGAYNEDFNGGFIYPKGLPLTSANQILEKAEQIMKEAQII